MNRWTRCWGITNIARRPKLVKWGAAGVNMLRPTTRALPLAQKIHQASVFRKNDDLDDKRQKNPDFNRDRNSNEMENHEDGEEHQRLEAEHSAAEEDISDAEEHMDEEEHKDHQEEEDPHHFAFSDNYSEAVLGGEISATVFDVTGKVVHVAHKMTKYEFLLEHGLYPRDLRNIDPSPVSIIPSILARGRKGAGRCILVNLLHIKALILHDKVLIFDTHSKNKSDTHRLGMFLYELENKLKPTINPEKMHTDMTVLPFELRVLEAILVNVMTTLDGELQVHLKTLNEILVGLEDHVDREQLKELLIGNKNVSRFYQKAVLIRDVLEELLESDDDLQQLYLGTHPKEGLAEVELLIESYCKQADEIVQQASNVRSHIRSTEEIVNIIVDANRNALMLLELKVTIVTVGFAVGAFVAALYGMNLENFIEETNEGMVLVVGVACLGGLLVTWFNLTKLHKTQKIAMFSNAATHTASKPYMLQWIIGLLRRKRTKSRFDNIDMSRPKMKGKKSNILHQLTKMTGKRR
ncbi:mitochondrial inner membrane magnesium transporter LPE10 [Yarrowia lipolytica]|uniref:Magnesium transporter n=1 Tax=Yarrowia lipolytica TaxID=4952 RepID=A0A371C2E8_YARLL|nr:mitochondrial inner membrane magnesium transporter LPE10 [Yarrowia lipolytica]RDW32519.1 mitochondrial inner membrane magnesium transporter LPE10 [Yarrowia lipolytica]RDW45249.1 mitochondrial inner membrane magnesium transporter LPE10 [Yarrowia lipolytica]RDW50935.1 mitochondrial inner membrane magnesium transporter LPE10 [Yarrowia lipolytica]